MKNRVLSTEVRNFTHHGDAYTNYVEDTSDPGIYFFLFTVLYCVCCVIAIPIINICIKKYHVRKLENDDKAKLPLTTSNAEDAQLPTDNPPKETLQDSDSSLPREDRSDNRQNKLEIRSSSSVSVRKLQLTK